MILLDGHVLEYKFDSCDITVQSLTNRLSAMDLNKNIYCNVESQIPDYFLSDKIK